MCKVFFERFSLDLMGKRRAGKGGRLETAGEMARRAVPFSSYDERRVKEREKKKGGVQMKVRGRVCFCFVLRALV